MKSLIWKEWRENLKWIPVPSALILSPIALFGMPSLMDEVFLFFVALVSAVFGAALGFAQIYPEATGDKRSLLVHRPLGSSRIFLGKVIPGLGIYLLGVALPFAGAVALSATPGHVPQPFDRRAALPWLADSLAGIVYYFAGTLAAQRRARWYGSRCLGLAAGVFGSYLVWMLPEFWQALAAAVITAGVVGLAAWGSFHAGGAFSPMPRPAKVALAVTLLAGLTTLSIAAKLLIGRWEWDKATAYYRVDRRGNVLLVREIDGRLRVTDLEGRPPPDLKDASPDAHALAEILSPRAQAEWPKTNSYRNSNRAFVKYGNDTEPGDEWWWYSPSRCRLVGFDKHSCQPIGSFGPDGFAGPGQPGQRFQGELIHRSKAFSSRANDYLVFPTRVYKVDFHKRVVQPVFTPAAGETVRWAARWEDEKLAPSRAFVLTDCSLYVVDEKGGQTVALPLADDLDGYQVAYAGRLEEPTRYWVWYEPKWYQSVDQLEQMPFYLVVHNASGQSTDPRRSIEPLPGQPRDIQPRTPLVGASALHAWLGLLTPPAEAAVLVGTSRHQLANVRAGRGAEVGVMLQGLLVSTQYFIPAVRWSAAAHPGIVEGFVVSMVGAAVACSLACFLLARRCAFSRAASIGWALVGLIFGCVGPTLMLALHELPARVTCANCGNLRVVTRENCEHCGAAQALPPEDGTEIFEPTTIEGQAVLTN
jgi:hypothetical protein